jgi:thiosulfate/3-mercaptopyruvate sulfurtransferase
MNRFLEPHEIPQNAIVLDARATPLYLAGHIPGARPIEFVSQKFIIRDAAGLAAFQVTLEGVIQQAGLDRSRPAVVYDSGPETRAARTAWALEYAGLEVGLLRGGFPSYQAAGLPLEQGMASWAPSDYLIQPRPELLSTADDLRDRLERNEIIVLDTRNDAEYQGATIPPGAPRGGHIPGAKHFDWVRVMTPEGYKSGAELDAAIQPILKDAEIVVHCQSGARSAALYQVLKERGYRVSNYVGSMNEWLSSTDLPVASGPGEEL